MNCPFEYAQELFFYFLFFYLKTLESQNNTLSLASKDTRPFGTLQIQTIICDFGVS